VTVRPSATNCGSADELKLQRAIQTKFLSLNTVPVKYFIPLIYQKISQQLRIFKQNFTHLTYSYLCLTAKYYSNISEVDKVMPLLAATTQ